MSSNLRDHSEIAKTPHIMVVITVAVRVGMKKGSRSCKFFALSMDCAFRYHTDQLLTRSGPLRGIYISQIKNAQLKVTIDYSLKQSKSRSERIYSGLTSS